MFLSGIWLCREDKTMTYFPLCLFASWKHGGCFHMFLFAAQFRIDKQLSSISVNLAPYLSPFVIQTAFTRCRYILKTVKNVTAAKFELAFTRCRHNLKTVGKLIVKTRSWTFMLKKSTYTLRIDQSRSKSVEK